MRLVKFTESTENGIEFSNRHIEKCEELNIPLYYPAPKDINIWFGKPILPNTLKAMVLIYPNY